MLTLKPPANPRFRCHWFTSPARTLVLVGALALAACGSDDTTFRVTPSGEAGAGGEASTDSDSSEGGQAGAPATTVDDSAFYDPSRVLEVAITVAPGDWDAIRKQTRGLETLLGADCQAEPFANPFSYVHADVVVNGKTMSDVGLRKKGFLGSLDDNEPSLKIAFDEYADQELFGSHDLTLNNAKQDPSYLNQCLGYATFAAAGVPASRCNFAHVTVNGQDLGLYVHVEAIKKPMLRRHFDSDEGNLYEGTLSDFREGWTGTFEKKTNESDTARPELDVITAAAKAPDDALLGELEKVLELDNFFSFWAVEVLLQHWDGYAGNQNNFYVYGDPTTSKVTLLPWGIDQLLEGDAVGNATPEPVLVTGVLAHRLYASAEGRRRFGARLRKILDEVWLTPQIDAEIDRMTRLITPFLTPGERLGHAFRVSQLKARTAARRAALLATLEAPAPELPPLRGLVCFREVGSVSGTFDTTWGTTGAEDPFAVGAATLDAVVDGEPWQLMPDSIGAMAGHGEDTASAFPESVAIPALRTDGMLGVLYFALTPEQIEPGDVLLGPATAPALLFDLDPNVKGAAANVRAAVFGTLHFDQAASVDGAPVSGQFDGKLYASGLLGTQ